MEKQIATLIMLLGIGMVLVSLLARQPVRADQYSAQERMADALERIARNMERCK